MTDLHDIARAVDELIEASSGFVRVPSLKAIADFDALAHSASGVDAAALRAIADARADLIDREIVQRCLRALQSLSIKGLSQQPEVDVDDWNDADHYKAKHGLEPGRLRKTVRPSKGQKPRLKVGQDAERRGGRWYYRESALRRLFPDVFN
jgi:hypothetical protein